MLVLILLGVVCIALVTSIALVFLKVGVTRYKGKFSIEKLLKNWLLPLGALMYFLASLFFVFLLKYTELSVLYPLATGFSYVFVAILAAAFLKEKIYLNKVVGFTFIVLGIVLVIL